MIKKEMIPRENRHKELVRNMGQPTCNVRKSKPSRSII